MKKILLLPILFMAVSLIACGSSNSLGGAEAGNPPSIVTTRSLVGQLSTGNASTSAFLSTGDCPADTAIALDSTGATVTASVESDCSFDLELPIDAAYAVHFVQDDTFVASVIFSNGAALPTSTVFVMSAGETAIDLGLVQIISGEAFPEVEPATENDQDDDGINDYEDDDDNNDGITDDQESDCDSDGYLSGYDDDDGSCDDSGGDSSEGGSGSDDLSDDH